VKVLAIFLPLALLLLPSFSAVAITVGILLLRKDPAVLWKPMHLTSRARRFYLAFGVLYGIVFTLSLAWAVYVFSESKLFAISMAISLVTLIAFAAVNATRLSLRLQPPPGGFADEEERAAHLAKVRDELDRQASRRYRFLKWYAYYIAAIALGGAAIGLIWVIIIIVSKIS